MINTKINKNEEDKVSNGLTPPILGEHFTIKRGYKMRPSTLRKLLEMKATHEDVNIYLSTILDDAINYYYEKKYIRS